MCWFTLTPAKSKRQDHSSDSSSAEELVRVHRSPSRPRFTDVKVKVPGSVSMEMSDHHHHHHPHLHPHLHHHHRHHLHPLHLHPLHGYHRDHHHHDHSIGRLHGPGRKRCPPPSPPPPTRNSSRRRPGQHSRSSSPTGSQEPIYRTQIVEPVEVRETTRMALRSIQPERQRGRLRRVAGYELLGSQVPFDWDCISSTAGSSTAGGKWVRKKAKGSSLNYPPFVSLDRWV